MEEGIALMVLAALVNRLFAWLFPRIGTQGRRFKHRWSAFRGKNDHAPSIMDEYEGGDYSDWDFGEIQDCFRPSPRRHPPE